MYARSVTDTRYLQTGQAMLVAAPAVSQVTARHQPADNSEILRCKCRANNADRMSAQLQVCGLMRRWPAL